MDRVQVSGVFYKGLMLFFSLALSLSVATWLRARQELQAVTVANEFLRKTLGDLTVAIAEKEREIDRLAGAPCAAKDSHKVARDRRRDVQTGPALH